MTRIRRLALDISSWVTWLASPGCKEWAEGLEREVAFIGNDWAALRWALGSVRVVFDRREAPVRSLEEAFAIAESFFEKKKEQRFWFVRIFPVVFGFVAVVVLSSLAWVGSSVTLAALLYGGMFVAALYAGYRVCTDRPLESDGGLDRYETVARYRAELQRFQDFKHGWANRLLTLISYAPFVVVVLVHHHTFGGSLFGDPELIILCFTLVIPGAIIDRLKDRANLRRIAELDALLAERG